MKYALKLYRATGSNSITVCPIVQVPDRTMPYRVRGEGYVESLQLYSTLAEAERAAADEQLVADYTRMDPSVLTEILAQDYRAILDMGVKTRFLCNSLIHWHCLDSYFRSTGPGRSPNPRSVARIHRIRQMFEQLREDAIRCLPPEDGTGNTRIRGGSKPGARSRKRSRAVLEEGVQDP